ncbi:hypothetical protein BDZ89DRAFT_883074, partial [Hymenopellis radicata]
DEDDETSGRFLKVHSLDAGTVFRMSQNVHEQWASLFGTPIPGDVEMDGSSTPDFKDVEWWKPFASELDWNIARWMVNEGIGHNAFNELMAIPGV